MTYHEGKKRTSAKILSILMSIMLVVTLLPPDIAFATDYQDYPEVSYDLVTDYDYNYEVQSNEQAPVQVVPFAESIPIRNAQELAQFLQGTLGSNSGAFHLAPETGNTIDISGMGPFQGRPGVFTGTFDGRGNTIRGLRLIPGPVNAGAGLTDGNIGFLRMAGGNAVIENVYFEGLENPAMRTFIDDAAALPYGWAAAEGRVGTVIGRVTGGTVLIENVRLTGSVYLVTARPNTAVNKHIGGFVGGVDAGATLNINDISADNLILLNQVGLTQSVGGVVGTTNGTVNINNPLTGGGSQTSVLIAQVIGLNSTSTTAMPNFAGGVIGRMESGFVNIHNVEITGAGLASRQIHGRTAAGGIVGWTGTTGQLRITNANSDVHSISTLLASGRAGGIVGRAGNEVFLTNVRNTADVTHLASTTAMIGGIIGSAEAPTNINGAWNYGNITHNFSAAQSQVGGIIGRSSNRISITNAHNRGDVRNRAPSGTAAAAQGNHVGGVIGQVMFPTAVAPINRRANLTNVSNRGAVNNQNVTNSNVAGRTEHTITAGGIIGATTNVASTQIEIDGAVNYGAVRARNRAGGIIGWADTPNIRIRHAENHGFISVTVDGTASRVGGIVGDSTRLNLVIERAGNTGTIRGLRRAGGAGGILGRASANGTVLREVFNYGHVSQVNNTGTGGIMGHNTGSLLIADFASLGSVQGGRANARGNRSGAGVLGMRGGGTVRIERGFVSGHWGRGMAAARDLGPAVAISGTGTARPVAGITFSQVYVIRDTAPTTAAARLQTGRSGIMALPSELLTSGFMPGFQGRSPVDGQLTWRFGMWNNTLSAVDPDSTTYPYFPWQVGGWNQWQERFFSDIVVRNTNPPRSPVSAPVGSASPIIDIINVHPWEFPFAGAPDGTGVQIFNPYLEPARATRPGTTGTPVQDAPTMRYPIAAPGNTNVTVPNARLFRNEVTIGLISQNNVTAFSAAPLEGIIVLIAVDAVTGEQIEHATFPTVAPLTTVGTVWVPAGSGEPVFIADEERFTPNVTAATVQAVGFTTRTGVTFTAEQLAAGGIIEIPMLREAIDINVRAMIESDDDIVVLVGPPNPALHHTPQRYSQTPTPPPILIGPGYWTLTQDGPRTEIPRQGNNGPYHVAGAFVGDRLEMLLAGFEGVNLYLNAGDLELVGGVWTLDIVLSDIRNQFPVTVRVWQDTGNFNANDEPILVPIAIGTPGLGDRLYLNAEDRNVPPMDPMSAKQRGATTSNTFTFPTRSLTTETALQILSYHFDFVDSAIYMFGDVREHTYVNPEAEEPVPNGYVPIDIILRDVVAREVHVMEQFGPEETDLRHIPHATLTLSAYPEDRAIAMQPPLSGTFPVRLADGDEIYAAAYGFHGSSYIVTTESGCPFPPGECILNCAYCPEHIIIVLDRMPAEPGGINGFVRNAADRAAIPNADVVVLNTAGAVVATATTNIAGFYSVDNLAPGTYFVMASASYFRPGASHHNPVTITGEAGAHADVYLVRGESEFYYSLFVNVTPEAINRDAIVVFFSGDRLDRDGALWSATFDNPREGLARAATLGFRDVTREVESTDYNQFRFAFINLHFNELLGPDYHQVVFHSNYDPSRILDIVTVRAGNTVHPLSPDPAREDYSFAGWYTHPENQVAETRWNFGTPITSDRHLYARWVYGDYTFHWVLFYRNDGTTNLHHSELVQDGGTLTLPADPTRMGGYTFRHWSELAAANSPAFTFPATITSAISVHAQWTTLPYLYPGYGGIFGVVTDPNGPVVGATVIITNATGFTRTVSTDDNGRYVAANLVPGVYTVTVISPAHGYQSRANVAVVADQWTEENFEFGYPDDNRYALITTVTGAPASAIHVITGGLVLERMGATNMFLLRTVNALPAVQLVHASAGATHHPNSAPVGIYDEFNVARVSIELQPVVIVGRQYQVTFYRNDGHVPQLVHYIALVDAGRTVDAPVNPHRPGWTFLGWYTDPVNQTDATRWNFGTIVAANQNLYARWLYEGDNYRQTHIVRFMRNDGTPNLHHIEFVPAGDRLYAPTDPVHAGFTFAYWSEQQLDFIRALTAFQFPMTPASDIRLHARWQIGQDVGYSVVFRMNAYPGDLTVIETLIVPRGQTVRPIENPNRVAAGYTFIGWEIETPSWAGSGPFNFGTPILGNLVLNAIWLREDQPRPTYTVLFERNDGSGMLHYAAFIPSGDQLLQFPERPRRVGFDFQGWRNRTTNVLETVPMNVPGNMTLDADWTPGTGEGWRVAFLLNDGTDAYHDVRFVNSGSTVTPPANPDRTASGFTFLGWEVTESQPAWAGSAGEPFNFGIEIWGNLVLRAMWRYDGISNAVETHTVRFWRNDGTNWNEGRGNLLHVAFVPDGEYVYAPSPNPELPGFLFEYWSITRQDFIRLGAFDLPMIPDGDIDLYARWRLLHGDLHTVVFRWNTAPTDYRIHATRIVNDGHTVTPPDNPSRIAEGFTFIGWEVAEAQPAWAGTSGQPFNFGTPIRGSLVLNAMWRFDGINNAVDTHTILFYRNDEQNNLHYAAFVPHGEVLTLPADPLRARHRFVHWGDRAADNSTAFNFPATITASFSVFARWEFVRDYGDITIDMDNNGNLTVTTPPGVDYTVERDDDGGAIITIPNPGDYDVAVNVPPTWNYEKRDDNGGIVVVLTPPTDFVPPDNDDIEISVDDDGNLTVTTPPGTDYTVENDDDGNVTVTFPHCVDEDDVKVNIPDDWEYDKYRDNDDNLVIVIRPPTQTAPGHGVIYGFITSNTSPFASIEDELEYTEEDEYTEERAYSEYEYQVDVNYQYSVDVDYTREVEVEFENEVEVQYEYEVEVDYEYEVAVPYTYEVEVSYEFEDADGNIVSGTRMETRTGTTTEVRTGTRTETRTGTRTEIETGVRTEVQTGTRTETRTGTTTETRTGIRSEALGTENELYEAYETYEIIEPLSALTPPAGEYRLAGATVVVVMADGTVRTTTSDAHGFYSIDVPVGYHTVIARIEGYATQIHHTSPIRVEYGQRYRTDFLMMEDPDGDYSYLLMVNVLPPELNRNAISVTRNGIAMLRNPPSTGIIWAHIGDESPIGANVAASATGRNPASATVGTGHLVGGDPYIALVNLTLTVRPDTPRPPPGGGGQAITPPQVPLSPFVEDHVWYVRGYEDGTFLPGRSITRAEISMILWRLLDSTAKHQQRPNQFNDVNTLSWYAQSVNYLASRNILRGYEDGSFRANQPITRAELTAVMSRFFEMTHGGQNDFADVNSSHWAYAYIINAHNKGWITGYGGFFRPNDSTTRAEAVTLLNRVLERVPNPVTIRYHLDGLRLFSDLTNAHWAFYDIMEAAIEHDFYIDDDGNEIWTDIFIPGHH